MQIAICDEVPGLPREQVASLQFNQPVISLRELIRARIALEMEQLAELASDPTSAEGRLLAAQKRFLVVPDSVERQLNGARGPYGPGTRPFPRRDGTVLPDEEVMAKIAFAAFAVGGFFVLTGERQILDLDEALPVAETGEMTFLKLTPLQGG
jgi:hypothetical protein